jgi:hypothetical protein
VGETTISLHWEVLVVEEDGARTWSPVGVLIVCGAEGATD